MKPLHVARLLACSAAVAVAASNCTTTSLPGHGTPAAGLDSPGAASSPGGSQTPTPSRSASVSASASPPAASDAPAPPPAPPADGDNVAACRDGTCEVAVTPGVAIPVDPALGVTTVVVADIGADELTVLFTFGQGTVRFDSGCNSASIGGGPFAANCSAGQTVTGNQVAVRVASLGAGTAVLKFSRV